MVRMGLACALAMTAALLGCSGSDFPETYPVTGKVTLQGKPVEGAQITFVVEGAPRMAMGTTDAEGNYTLSTFEPGDGAMPGSHKVMVASPAVEAPVMDPGNPGGDYGAMMRQAASGRPAEGAIPPKYNSPQTSGLTAEVTAEGPNAFDFDLQP